MRAVKMLVAALMWMVATGAVAAQKAPTSNPAGGDAAAIGRGALLFRARCASCHGLDAKGVSGPDLTTALAGTSDEQFFRTVRSGRGTDMPRFSSEQTSDVQVWEVLAHLRGVSRGEVADAPTGDAVKGGRIFQTRCAACHRVNGKGGALGPDLTRIGSTRSPSALARKVRDPSQAPVPGYRPVTVVLGDGRRVRGVVKNEDAFSIQIMDVSERIQGFSKRDVREIVRENRSPMPSFGVEQVSDADLNDLVSHLTTLGRSEPRVP